MPLSATGGRVTPVVDFPSRDGLSAHAIRVDYEPARLIAFLILGDGESATLYHRV